MDWLKKNFDRAILAAIGLIVIVCSGLIISQALSFNDQFATRNSSSHPNNNVPVPGTEMVKERFGDIEKPHDWGTHPGSLFVSDPYVIKDGGKPINPLEGNVPLFPPIPNKWVKDYGLDFSDPNLAEADPDNDKFTNVEEFNGKTDPTDPKSIPSYIAKLRFVEFIQVPFRLKFSGSPDEGTYSINTLDLHGPTQFLKLGDMVEGTPYKLVNYEHKTKDKDGLEVDISELTVQNQETGQKIILVNDQPVNDPTVFARFKYMWDGSELKIKKNDTFSVKPQPDVKYKLIDISDSEAVIESAQGEKTHIPKASS